MEPRPVLASEDATIPPAAPDATATLPPGDPGATTPPASVGVAGHGDAPPGYEILDELGRGGMGVVYKARQVALNRVCALKMILSGGHAGADDLARFETEAQAIARLQHPGIVQVFEVGTHQGRPFMALELCAGGSLDRKLSGTPLPPREAAALVRKLAEAMEAAHEAHVIHRDLKPANVLLTADGTSKITDFGLAKKLDDSSGQTQTGAIMGTPSYMAPEQAEGKKDVGPLADVYALGAILYDCLTGRPPFRAATSFDTLMQVVSEEPVPPRTLNPSVPADLETVCLKCLNKNPRKRYASAKELADDLGRWLAGEPIKARPVGRVERYWIWCKREPVKALMVAALLIGTAVASGLAWWALAEKARGEDIRHSFQVDLALRSLDANDVLRAETLVNDSASRFQGSWETRFIRAICRRKALPLPGHDGLIFSVAISPDGQRVASGERSTRGAAPSLKVWDVQTGLQVHELKGHAGNIRGLAFSPDGAWLASSSGDRRELSNPGVLKIWNAVTGQEKFEAVLPPGPCESGVSFSPDGRRVACGSRVWDAATGKELLTLERGAGRAVFSPDGKFIVGGRTQLVRWDAVTGEAKYSRALASGAIESIAISQDGKRIVCGLGHGSSGGQVTLWDAETGQEQLTVTRREWMIVWGVSFTPDGERIACGCHDGSVRILDAKTGEELSVLIGHRFCVHDVSYSRDGKRLVSGADDRALRVWSTEATKERLVINTHKSPLQSMDFSPDGKHIMAAFADGAFKAWDAGSGEETPAGAVRESGTRLALAYTRKSLSPDGTREARIERMGRIDLVAAGSHRVLLSFRGHLGDVASLAYSPDGKRILSGGHDGTFKLWDTVTGAERLSIVGHRGPIPIVGFSPDGNQIVTGGLDGRVKIWDCTP